MYVPLFCRRYTSLIFQKHASLMPGPLYICTRSRVGDFTEESRIVLAKGGETRKGDLLGIVSELPAN